MSQPERRHICFYSNRCVHSKAFIDELKNTPYFNEIRFICVDPSPNRPPLPSWLKQTPTLVISGEPEPRINSEVANWLYERKLKDSGSNNQNQSNEPEAYLDMEMGGGFGDSYSFLSADTSAQGNGGMTMKHNFTYLNGQDSVGTREASSFQTTDTTAKQSKKEQLLNAQMEQYIKQRDQQGINPIKRQ